MKKIPQRAISELFRAAPGLSSRLPVESGPGAVGSMQGRGQGRGKQSQEGRAPIINFECESDEDDPEEVLDLSPPV